MFWIFKENKYSKLQSFTVGISLILFAFSLTQKAMYYEDYDGPGSYHSINVFLIGGIGILGDGLLEFLIWLANPIYYLSVFSFIRKTKMCVVLSTLAIVISGSFMLWDEILVAENGRNEQITSLGIGYYLWFSSIVVLAVGVIIQNKAYL